MVVAGGAATFAIGEPVTMTAIHIKFLGTTFPEITIIITHLEAVSPCTENREFTRNEITKTDFFNRYYIPMDGEHFSLG